MYCFIDYAYIFLKLKSFYCKLASYIDDTLCKFGLDEKVVFAVRDCGANMKKGCRLSSLHSDFDCLGHNLHNLIMHDGVGKIPELNLLLGKLKDIIKKLTFHSAVLEEEALNYKMQKVIKCADILEIIENDEQCPLSTASVPGDHEYEDNHVDQEAAATLDCNR